MIKPGVPVVEDTEENRQTCRKNCTNCPIYKRHALSKYEPSELFCARGTSPAGNTIKELGCYCPACEIFNNYHLRTGYFCVKH